MKLVSRQLQEKITNHSKTVKKTMNKNKENKNKTGMYW
jgi:hypothetical protein